PRSQNPRNGCAKGVVLFTFTLALAAQETPHDLSYHLEPTQPLSRFTSRQRLLLQKLNRVDAAHLARWNRLIVPTRWQLEELASTPMPVSIDHLSNRPRSLIVSLPAQVFGAYEFGSLVRWGPVSSGSLGRATTPGRYRLNWNSRLRISSINDDWIMPWYF